MDGKQRLKPEDVILFPNQGLVFRNPQNYFFCSIAVTVQTNVR